MASFTWSTIRLADEIYTTMLRTLEYVEDEALFDKLLELWQCLPHPFPNRESSLDFLRAFDEHGEDLPTEREILEHVKEMAKELTISNDELLNLTELQLDLLYLNGMVSARTALNTCNTQWLQLYTSTEGELSNLTPYERGENIAAVILAHQSFEELFGSDTPCRD